MHVIDSAYTWLIYNLNTKHCYSQIRYEQQYVHMHIRIVTFLFVNPPLVPSLFHSISLIQPVPLFTYLEILFFCSWCEYPSTLVPGWLSTVLPLLLNPPLRLPTDQVTYLHRWHQQHQPSRLIQSLWSLHNVFRHGPRKSIYEYAEHCYL